MTQENELFERLLRLRDTVAVVKGEDADAVAQVRRELHALRLMAAGMPYSGKASLRKIHIAPPDLGTDFSEDWRALVATLRQKGLNWC